MSLLNPAKEISRRFEKDEDGDIVEIVSLEKRRKVPPDEFDKKIQEIDAQKLRLDEAKIVLQEQKLVVADLAKI